MPRYLHVLIRVGPRSLVKRGSNCPYRLVTSRPAEVSGSKIYIVLVLVVVVVAVVLVEIKVCCKDSNIP